MYRENTLVRGGVENTYSECRAGSQASRTLSPEPLNTLNPEPLNTKSWQPGVWGSAVLGLGFKDTKP